jgi:hypothetical protein
MTTLVNSLNSVVTAGIGGVAFLGTWIYLMLHWLDSLGLGIGGGFSLGSQSITIPWLW